MDAVEHYKQGMKALDEARREIESIDLGGLSSQALQGRAAMATARATVARAHFAAMDVMHAVEARYEHADTRHPRWGEWQEARKIGSDVG